MPSLPACLREPITPSTVEDGHSAESLPAIFETFESAQQYLDTASRSDVTDDAHMDRFYDE
jgi:hypothetical protein